LSYREDKVRGDEEREARKTALLVFAEHKNLNSKENMDNE